MKFYYVIGRLTSPLQRLVFFVYNKIFDTPRSRVMVVNENEELLLVRNWAGKQQWGLPGGGVGRHERPVSAAKRELFEEIGIKVSISQLVHVTTERHQYEAWIYKVAIKKSSLAMSPHNPWEITAMQWFPLSKLPADLSPLIPLALEKLSKND